MTGKLSLSWHGHHGTVVSFLQTFLVNDSFVDCTLAAEGRYLKAHKVVLSACSPYFQLLFNQENDKNPIVILKDVQYECLKMVVDFMYHGKVQVRDTQLSTFMDVARSLQIKGLDSRHEATPKRASSKPSKANGIASQLMEGRTSDQVIAGDVDRKVVKMVNMTSVPEPPHGRIRIQSESVKPITIESAYSMAPSTSAVTASDDLADVEGLRSPTCTVPLSVSSSVSNLAESLQLSEVQETNPRLKCNSIGNFFVKINDSSEPETEPEPDSQNKGPRCNDQIDSTEICGQMEEEANKDYASSSDDDGDNSSESRRKPCSSSASTRSVMSLPVPRKIPRPQQGRRASACERSQERVQDSSKPSVQVSAESPKKPEVAALARMNPLPSDAFSRVLSVVLCKTKFPMPIATSVPHKATSPEQPSKGSGLKKPRPKRKWKSGKRHTCPECKKEFMRPSYLISHRRLHTGEKPYPCLICNKRFAQSGALKRHSRVHTGERPHACEFCHKTFNRANSLKIHKRLHTGERPYVCPECGKSFVAHSQLWAHKRVHMDGNYKCDACGECFKRKPLLSQHWKIFHETP